MLFLCLLLFVTFWGIWGLVCLLAFWPCGLLTCWPFEFLSPFAIFAFQCILECSAFLVIFICVFVEGICVVLGFCCFYIIGICAFLGLSFSDLLAVWPLRPFGFQHFCLSASFWLFVHCWPSSLFGFLVFLVFKGFVAFSEFWVF